MTCTPQTRGPLKSFALDSLIFTVAAFLPFVGTPAIVHAQETTFTPLPITGGLNVSRGQYTPENQGAFTLAAEDYCDLLINGWGWPDCDGIDAFVFDSTEATDSLILYTPDSSGYVTFEDWTPDAAEALVGEIETALLASARDQSARTGTDIRFLGWRVPPTLDREAQTMFYATDWSFDGDVSINVSATLFDRRGYVEASMIPFSTDLDAAQVQALIRENVAGYVPTQGQDYASFVTGDKVAAVGALGLLGGFFGVKYGKAAAGGLMAALLAGKKFIGIALIALLAAGGAILRGLVGLFGRRDPEA
ncbi:MAG: DUF2167 domain-containing protein [Pseudomonadota bacterium]